MYFCVYSALPCIFAFLRICALLCPGVVAERCPVEKPAWQQVVRLRNSHFAYFTTPLQSDDGQDLSCPFREADRLGSVPGAPLVVGMPSVWS